MKFPPADALGRIVVVAAGFALWQSGRCIAAARWSDIKRILAYRAAAETSTTVRLVVELADETTLEFLEEAPGFDLFLDRAQMTLPRLLRFAEWHPSLMLAPRDGEGVVIFARPASRK